MKRETFSFNRGMPALGLVPPDEKLYPAANAVRRVLTEGLRFMQLNSRAMRQPCPATRPTDLELDGSNLARVVGRLLGKNGSARERTEAEANTMQRWVEHLRYALPDLDSIGWGRREPDNAEYITLKCKDGLVCPSWLVSDGTLRMLALTLLAFLPPAPGIYLIEEPENGVHPKALELIMRSLSSVPSAQVFVATHSPLVVQLAGRDSLLCFQKDEEGTHITHGADHPRLREWDGVPDLATVFACGILE